MKKARFLLYSSGLNLILAIACLVAGKNHASPVSISEADVIDKPPSISAILPTNTLSLVTNTVVGPFRWSMIESADYRKYVANLRAAGCSERLIRDIIVADITKLYQGRELDLPRKILQPWDGAAAFKAARREQETRRRELGQERKALIRELLGYDWEPSDRDFDDDGLIFGVLGFVSEEKAIRLISLVTEHIDAVGELNRKSDGIWIEEDQIALTNLYRGWLGNLTQLLSPTELDEAQVRAQLILFLGGKMHLEGVNLSGMELRQVAKLSQSYANVVELVALNRERDLDELKPRDQETFERGLVSLLGPERYSDYQRAQDEKFRDIFRFTEVQKLPESAAVSVYNVRRATEEEAGRIRDDASLSADQRTAALEVLATATIRSLNSALGNASPQYLTNNAPWLGNLALPPDKGSEAVQ